MRFHPPILVAALLLVPAVSANWSSAGSYEPSTNYDTASYMFQDAPQTPGKRVYFNAFATTSTPAGGVRVNPNVAALQSRIEPPGAEFMAATLGVWTDCNKDGYVGMAEGALREYDAALLNDATVCPPSTGPRDAWDGNHNYNGVVTELIPIMRAENENDLRRYVDPTAAVWGDFHRPDEKPFTPTCALAPQPRGTYQSSGGVINYVDCRAAVLETMNDGFDLVGDPLGLRFGDEDDARSGTIGQFETFGSEDSSRSAVNVWDCSADAFRSGDVINDTAPGIYDGLPEEAQEFRDVGHDILIYSPSTQPIGNTEDPTIPGTVNHSVEGLPVSLEGVGDGTSDSDCDTSDDRGEDFYGNRYTFYVGEEDFSGVDPKNKRQANWNLAPVGVNRRPGDICVEDVETCAPNTGTLVDSGPAGHAGDGGVNPVIVAGPRWESSSIQVSKPGPSLVRGADIAPAYWLTFYAKVGNNLTDVLTLPPSGGVYGAPHCGLNTSGIFNGWNCDPNAWYINPDGSPMPDAQSLLARVGDRYDLRDVDCYDGSTNLGVAVGAPFYGSAPCP